jgi:hypothetical protein
MPSRVVSDKQYVNPWEPRNEAQRNWIRKWIREMESLLSKQVKGG